MIRTRMYRLYPDSDIEAKLLHSLECCRQIYNTCLEQRIMLYKDRKKSISRIDQQNQVTETKSDFPGVHSQVLQDPTFRLQRSFNAFFRRVAKGEKPGFPRFKPPNRYHSFTYPQSHGFSIHSTKKGRAKLRLGCVGKVKMRYHRPIPNEAKMKTCTILRKNQKWYAIICIEIPDIPLSRVSNPVGIDVGLTKYATLSTNKEILNPRFHQDVETKLKKEQRRLSKKQGGRRGEKKSNNYKKQALKVARLHEDIRNKRFDFLHNLSRDLINNYSYIKVENLQIQNLMKNNRLAKSIADAGWGTFFRMLSYKAEDAGTLVEFVNPSGTSQTCICGARVPKTLKDRIHVCPKCGLIADRDWVSSVVIASRVGTTRSNACGEVRAQATSMKQEKFSVVTEKPYG